MDKELRILILEDVPADAELEEHGLRKAGLVFTSKVVDTREAFLKELEEFFPDIILSDYELPTFDGLAALRIAQEKCPDVPFILVTGKVGEEFVIDKLKDGATDYVLKSNLQRLVPSVKRALKEAEEITERKRLRRVLQESEKLYRLLAENTNDMITRHLPDGTYLYVSPACRTLFGYEPEDLIGTNAFTQIHPEDVKRVITITQEAVRKGGSNVSQYRHRIKDGQYIWVETTGKVVKNEITGNIEDIICVVRDITERKQAEEAQKKSENKFRNLFNSASDAIAIHDMKGHFFEVNDTLCNRLGYSREELLRLTAQDIDTEENANHVQVRINTLKKQGYLTFETAHVSRDGKVIPVEVSSRIIDYEGEKAVLSVARDITERKKNKEALKERDQKYQLLFNNVSDAIIVHEISPNITEADRFRIIEANDIACQYLGYTREELLQMDVRELDATEAPGNAKILHTLFTEGRVIWEGIHKHKDGHKIPVEISNQLFNLHGKVMSLASARDITERKKAEAAMKQSGKKLRNIVEHSNELYYAHDTHHALNYASPQSLQILGYTPEEMMIEWTKLATENPINKKGIEITEKALKTGEKQEPYLLELYKKDRSKVLLEIDESPIKDNKGKVVGIVGAARDVTERVKAAEALKKSQQQIHMLLDSTAEAIYGIDLEGKCTFVNAACLRILGYDNYSKILGENMHNLIHFKYPDGSEYPAAKCKIYQAFKRGERVNVDEEVFWKADGTNFPAEYWSYPIKEEGKAIGAVVSFIDITERKKAEEIDHIRTDQIILNKEALLELTRMQTPDIETFSKIITLMCSQVLGVERVSVWFYNNVSSEIICEALYILSKHSHEKGFRLQTKDYPTYFKALEEDPVLAVDDAHTDPRTNEFTEQYLKPLGIFSMMDIPIRRHGKVIGIMCYESIASRQWTYEDQHFAASVAHIVTTALEDFERRKTAEALIASEQELIKRVNDLEDFYKMAVGRELRMKELKGEIAELKEELAKYKSK